MKVTTVVNADGKPEDVAIHQVDLHEAKFTMWLSRQELRQLITMLANQVDSDEPAVTVHFYRSSVNSEPAVFMNTYMMHNVELGWAFSQERN